MFYYTDNWSVLPYTFMVDNWSILPYCFMVLYKIVTLKIMEKQQFTGKKYKWL